MSFASRLFHMAENPEDARHDVGTTPPAEETTEFDDDTKRGERNKDGDVN